MADRKSIRDLLATFREKIQEQYAAAEGDKLGTLRGGNTGAMYTDGRGVLRVIGKCARLSHLRSMGIQSVPGERSQDMFDGGLANEHRWLEKMRLAWPGLVKAEEEIPTRWLTKNGTVVTGRPDIVLCSSYTVSSFEDVVAGGHAGLTYTRPEQVTTHHSDPLHGLELKNVSSLWTARDVLFNSRPKMGHLLQTAHYSWQLGVPFSLCYTSTAKYPSINKVGPNKIKWPAPGEPLSEYMEHDQWGDGDPFPRSILPFNQIFDISAEVGEPIYYRVEGTDEWNESPVGVGDIRDYYEFVSEMGTTHDLGPRPTQLKPDGTKANFKQCDNCVFSSACDNYDGGSKRGSGDGHGDYDEWLHEIALTKKGE